jgi:hypothetical protein
LLPHAGVIFSTTANPTNKEHYLSSSGFTSGMSLKIQLDNTVSVVTGAWYERKGYGLDYVGTEKFIYVEPNNESTSSYVNTETDLDYLTFPFLFEFKIGRRFSANMNFGFYYSILQNAMVRGDYIYTNSGGGSYSVQKEYINDKMVGWFKNSDVGVLSGIRFEYPVFSNTNVFLGINYANGFKNVLDINETDFPSFGRNQKIINSSFSTMFGISFSSHKSDIL